MVEQSHRFILKQLRKMTEGDPDRDFLEGIGTRLGNRLRAKEETEQSAIDEENLTVDEAWARIQKMTVEDNFGKRPLSLKQLTEHASLQESSPENSVARLLPMDWRGFRSTVHLLFRHDIKTKEQLIAIPSSLIRKGRSSKSRGGKIRQLGPKKIPFALAMRDLAIAEARERSSQIS